ncbi:MAG: hypothetical protein NT001_06190 [Candidatus Woesearchaeota archaeon]|nr:hypothetical protein [Candidatus Woesearchaeota archaeon]
MKTPKQSGKKRKRLVKPSAQRIERIVGGIRVLWKRNPDLRFGQLLENYMFTGGERKDKTSMSLFYQDDRKTEAILKKLVGKKEREDFGTDEEFLDDIFDTLDGRILNTKKIRKELYKNTIRKVNEVNKHGKKEKRSA